MGTIVAAADLGPICQVEQQVSHVLAHETRTARDDAAAGRHAIPMVDERAAAQVEREERLVGTHGGHDAHVGTVDVNEGAAAAQLAQTVADGVLHAQGRKAHVAHAVVAAARLDGDGGSLADVALPRERLGGLVQLVDARHGVASQDERDAAGQACPQAHPVGAGKVAVERDAAAQGPDATRAQPMELLGERLLEACGAQCRKLKLAGGVVDVVAHKRGVLPYSRDPDGS